MSFSIGGPCVLLCPDRYPSDKDKTSTEAVVTTETEEPIEFDMMVLNYESNQAENILENYRLSFIEVHAKGFYTGIFIVASIFVAIFFIWLCRKRAIIRWRRSCCNGCCSSGVGEEEEAERAEMMQLKKNVGDIMLLMENARTTSVPALTAPSCPGMPTTSMATGMSSSAMGSGEWVNKKEIKDYIQLQIDLELAQHDLDRKEDAKNDIYTIEQRKI